MLFGVIISEYTNVYSNIIFATSGCKLSVKQVRDIIMPENSPVHSISEGIVVFSEWTTETGYVIIIEHLNGLTSIYKHNASIVKSQGEMVETGEIIAFTGNTGELTTGPHLHYEVIVNGKKVNSQKLKLPSGKVLKGKERKLFETKKIKLDVLKSEKIFGIN